MRIKRLLTSIVLPLFFILISSQAIFAATTANTFQITNDVSQQKDSIIYKNNIAFTNFGGTQRIDIWNYNLNTLQNTPLVVKTGDQFLTAHFGKYIVYDDFDGTDYNVRLYNKNNGTDILIAGGTGSQTSGVTNGDYVIYIDGGACGSVHSYNLKKKQDNIISPTGCTPLRIYDNTVIWPYGAPGGTNIYGYNLDHHNTFDVVDDIGFQESPNIFDDKVVYLDYVTGNLGDYNAIKVKDLGSGEVNTIYQSTTSALQWPSISDKYVVWSESTAQHINGIKAANLKTGEVFEVQTQEPHQNSHTMPTIWKNYASWMSFRSGNGDIYASIFNK